MRNSRGHIALALYSHIVMTAIFYSGFPYDNVCKGDGSVLDSSVFAEAQEAHGVSTDAIFTFCHQDPSSFFLNLIFSNGLDTHEMDKKQSRAVLMYAGFCALTTVVLIIAFFGHTVIMGIYGLFYGRYKGLTDANAEHFSHIDDVQAYIPEIAHPQLAYPLVAAEITTMDKAYLSFEMDSLDHYMQQSIVREAEFPGADLETIDNYFSNVKYYPVPDDLKIEEEVVQRRKSVIKWFRRVRHNLAEEGRKAWERRVSGNSRRQTSGSTKQEHSGQYAKVKTEDPDDQMEQGTVMPPSTKEEAATGDHAESESLVAGGPNEGKDEN